MEQWLDVQQQEAKRTDDRTRDVFCRRAAVVGFRAGMLAWFLYGEKNTATYRRNTIAFARWIASQMLTQHLLRFQIEGNNSNIKSWEEVYQLLGDEFTREDVQRASKAKGISTPIKTILYRWRLIGFIEGLEEGRCSRGQIQTVKFRKLKAVDG